MADMLATTADLAALLQRDVDTASATLALEVSTAVIQAVADGQRILQVVGDTAVIDLDPGFCGQFVTLAQRPATAVTSVTIGTTAVTDYVVQYSKRRLWRADGWQSPTSSYWLWQPTTVTVVYTHGYAVGDQKLQLARGTALSIARDLFTNPDGTVREQIDDYQVAYAQAEMALEGMPGVKALLRKQYGAKAGMARIY